MERYLNMKYTLGIIRFILAFSIFWIPVALPAQVNFTYHSEFAWLKGKDAAGLPAGWMTAGFDDTGWATGNAPFRYGDGTGGFELTDMRDNYSTLYLRSHFECTNADLIIKLTLTVDYDDGFVIWINGVEALRQNVPGSLSYNAFAPIGHESGEGEEFTIDAADLNLVEGTNLVAVQGFNISLTSSDFYFDLAIAGEKELPELIDSMGVLFSHPSGFYDSPFELTLTSPETGTNIVYTLDGSNPQDSPSAVTADSITIIRVDPASTTGRPLTPGFVVRASVSKPGLKPSKPGAATYLFIESIKTQSWPGGEWPNTNINGQIIDIEMDSKVVDNPEYNTLIDDALLDIPTISIITDVKNLFDPATGIYVNAEEHGPEWERECSVELIQPEGSEGFNVNAGLRIRGGWSRHDNYPKHAFRLFFREAYGDDKLYFSLFGEEGADQFDKIDLRTAENYAWSNGFPNNTLVREVFSRDSQRDMGQPYTRSRYYHLYLNGMYWGLYQTQERSEARFAETYFGGAEEDYDVVKVNMEDFIYQVEATDGTLESWQRIWDMCNNGFTSNSDYFKLEGKDALGNPIQGAEVFLDIDNLIDYMIIIFYTGNFDAPASSFQQNKGCNNFYAIDNRNDRSTGFTFFNHDAEHSMFYYAHSPGIGINEDRVNLAERDDNLKLVVYDFQHFHPQWLHHKLCQNAEYRSRFADRAYRYLTAGGALSEEESLARINTRVDQIDLAIIAESARWGDALTGGSYAYTRNEHWVEEIYRIRDLFIPSRTTVVIEQLLSAGLYKDLEAPEVKVSGVKVLKSTYPVTAPLSIFIENNNDKGTIYYTLNGKDPRMVGGGIRPEAQHAEGSVSVQISGSTVLKARIMYHQASSALKEVIFVKQQEDYDVLKVTELHYHPPDWVKGSDTIPGTDLEFIEFINTGTQPLNLSGLSLDSAVRYQFPENALLYPQQFFVVASYPPLFYEYYSLVASGNYTGHFSNAGEEVLLTDPTGMPIIHFTYDDHTPWPAAADGTGLSLNAVELNPAGDPDDFTYWTVSLRLGGTPFAHNFPLSIDPSPAALEGALVAYPNPTSDLVTFHLKAAGEMPELDITIFNMTGIAVYHETISNNSQISFSSLDLDSGLYLFRIEADGIVETVRIVLVSDE
jgi:hypothetical protein